MVRREDVDAPTTRACGMLVETLDPVPASAQYEQDDVMPCCGSGSTHRGEMLTLIAAARGARARRDRRRDERRRAAGHPGRAAAAHRRRRSRRASVVQTIPSLAIFGFLLPLPLIGGIGARTALVALILYGLLPIVRRRPPALDVIDPAAREAGDRDGPDQRQRLRHVELPLALPGIIAGIRVAAVTASARPPLRRPSARADSASYIFRGLSMVDTT